MVELPSKPQLGRSARVGGCSNALSRLLPRRSGTGFLPSSQMYSSLYFVMGILLAGKWWGLPRESYGFGYKESVRFFKRKEARNCPTGGGRRDTSPERSPPG